MTKSERIREWLADNPTWSDGEVARYLDVSRKAVYNVRKAMNGQKTQPTPLHCGRDGSGNWVVLVNGRVWQEFKDEEAARAEAEFLRWPKEPAA
jgi:hypothetical protein